MICTQVVGTPENLAEPDCSLIDFDSLLLGGCWCHKCLPENPCQANGVCVRYKNQGYTCACPAGRTGDHCQFDVNGTMVAWPWYMLSAVDDTTSGGDDVLIWMIPAICVGLLVLVTVVGVVKIRYGGLRSQRAARTADGVQTATKTIEDPAARPVKRY
jgi:hypothetical protein